VIGVAKPAEGAMEFPFLGLAVAVLALHSIFAVVLPPSPIRSAVAIVAFFAMGYSLLTLIAGGRLRLNAAEVLAYTVGLTILLTSLSALTVSLIGIPITEFAVVIIGLPLSVVTWLTRRPRLHPRTALAGFGRRYFDFSEYSPGEKWIATALFAAIIGAVVFLLFLSVIEFPDRPSPGLAITGPDGTPQTLPTTFVIGQPKDIIVTGMGGPAPGSFVVQIRLIPANATGSESFHNATQLSPLLLDPFAEYREPITLAAGGTWAKRFSIALTEAGVFDLYFDLIDGVGTVVASNHIPVDAS